MVRFRENEIANCYAAKSIKIWDVNIDYIVISKLIETKPYAKYLVEIKFGKAIRPLVLVIPKISGFVKKFKVKEGNNKLISFCIDHEKILEKYKAIWTKIEDLKNTELNALPVYDDKYIKTKIRTYVDKVYISFHGLNVPEDDIECESLTVISIDSLLVYYKKYYLQVYLDNCTYKLVNKQMTDYLEKNLFEG